MVNAYLYSFARLRCSLESISRIFMASVERPDIPFVFDFTQNEYKLTSWCSYIARDPLRYQDCTVTSVDHRKSSGSKEHEYLCITILHTSGHTAFLVVERCVDVSSSSDAMKIGVQSTAPREAYDRLKTLKKLPKDDGESISVTKWAFNNPDRTPSVLQLSVALSVVSHHAPTYNVYAYQCYWYAHTASELLRLLFQGEDVTSDPSKKRQRGKLSSCNVPTQDSIAAVRDGYQVAWELLNNQMSEVREELQNNTMV